MCLRTEDLFKISQTWVIAVWLSVDLCIHSRASPVTARAINAETDPQVTLNVVKRAIWFTLRHIAARREIS